MKYYSIQEVVEEVKGFKKSKQQIYQLIKDVEENTPHRYGKMFRGNYYRGHKRKEKVVSERDLMILKKILEKVDQGALKKTLIQNVYGSD